MDLDTATRKDWQIMLTDALMSQMIEKQYIPYLKEARMNTKSSAQKLQPGIRVISILYKIIRESDYKTYGIQQGITPDLPHRKDLYTMLQMFFMALEKHWNGKPTTNTLVAVTNAIAHLKTFNAQNIFQLYPQYVRESRTASNIIRLLNDRDQFLIKASNSSNNNDAAVSGCHPLCGVINAVVSCAQPFFKGNEPRKRDLFTRLSYVLAVQAYMRSFEYAGGGMTTINTLLALGRRGPYIENIQGLKKKLWLYEESGDDEQAAQEKLEAMASLTTVQATICKEILAFPDLFTYINQLKLKEDCSTRSMRRLLADFSEENSNSLINKPILLQSTETRELAKKELEKLEPVFKKLNNGVKEDDVKWCQDLLMM